MFPIFIFKKRSFYFSFKLHVNLSPQAIFHRAQFQQKNPVKDIYFKVIHEWEIIFGSILFLVKGVQKNDLEIVSSSSRASRSALRRDCQLPVRR